MAKGKRWCVWVRFSYRRDDVWGPWRLAFTFENLGGYFTAHRMALANIKEYWTCKEQRVMLPEGRRPKGAQHGEDV